MLEILAQQIAVFDSEFTKWLLTLGVGGALAAFMFAFYRKDVRQYTELWKAQAELNRQQISEMMNVIKDNTASNTKLITLIENIERNQMRKDDISALIRAESGKQR